MNDVVVPYKGLHGAAAHCAATARTPLLIDKCTGSFYVQYTAHGTLRLYVPLDEYFGKLSGCEILNNKN